MKQQKLIGDKIVLDQGNIEDYRRVYEFDFTKLRNICDEFVFQKYDNEYILKLMSMPNEKNNEYEYSIYLKNNMFPIGNITADRKNEELNSIELSFNMHPDYWGNGYMQEAIKLIIKYLFSLEYQNVICSYSEGNYKSKNLIEKIGFEFLEKEENSWFKNGVPITDYRFILSKENFFSTKKR